MELIEEQASWTPPFSRKEKIVLVIGERISHEKTRKYIADQ